MIYADDYGIVDLYHLVHAIPVEPCTDPDHEGPHHWSIGLVLQAGHNQPFHLSALHYPSSKLRDGAFEEIVTKMKKLAAARDEDWETVDEVEDEEDV